MAALLAGAADLLKPANVAIELAWIVVVMAGIIAKSLRDRAAKSESECAALRARFDEYIEKRHTETVEMARRVEAACGGTTDALEHQASAFLRIENEVRKLEEEIRRCLERTGDALRKL